MYTKDTKICDLVARQHESLQIISRFGLPLGVGEKTIEEVCQEHNVHTETFLTVVNYKLAEAPSAIRLANLSMPTLITYLRNAHSYFFDFALPMLRRKLVEALNYSGSDNRIPMLIMRFFDEYVNEINVHMEHENEQMFPYIEALLRNQRPAEHSIEEFAHQHRAVDDQHIAGKLNELKNLIVKYYPQPTPNNLLNSALYDIYQVEEDLATHCEIEDEVLIPAIRQLEKTKMNTLSVHGDRAETAAAEVLSDREKDVLIEVVNGLSNKEIADKLCISVHTVISHRKNIVRKLNIRSAAGLTIFAIVNKLIDIEETISPNIR